MNTYLPNAIARWCILRFCGNMRQKWEAMIITIPLCSIQNIHFLKYEFSYCLFELGLFAITLRWRHNEHDGVSNHQPYDCLLNCYSGVFKKKTSKLRVTGLCAWNSSVTGKFPAQMASNAENDSIWWRHHAEAWFMWDVAIELFLKCNGGVSKQALKSGHEWSIIIHC